MHQLDEPRPEGIRLSGSSPDCNLAAVCPSLVAVHHREVTVEAPPPSVALDEQSGEGQGVLALDLLADEKVLVFESCELIWIIDTERRQLCRLARTAKMRAQLPAEWITYERALLDEETKSAIVLLDPQGTRMLRVRAHQLPCPDCGASSNDLVNTAELIGLAWR